jgi:hypothetical protein
MNLVGLSVQGQIRDLQKTSESPAVRRAITGAGRRYFEGQWLCEIVIRAHIQTLTIRHRVPGSQ